MQRPNGITLLSVLLGFTGVVGIATSYTYLSSGVWFVFMLSVIFHAAAIASSIGFWRLQPWAKYTFMAWSVLCVIRYILMRLLMYPATTSRIAAFALLLIVVLVIANLYVNNFLQKKELLKISSTNYINYKKSSLFVLAAIILYFLSDREKPEIKEMKRLCALDSGNKVYETVQADGYLSKEKYYESLVFNDLATPYETTASGETAYQYVEFCNPPPYYLTDEKAIKAIKLCWRVEKVPRSSGRCNANADAHLKKKVVSPYVEFMKDQCITVEDIEKPISHYQVDYSAESWNFKDDESIVYTKYKTLITEISTTKMIAESTNYGMAYKNRDIGNVGCKSPEVTGKDYISSRDREKSLITQTIKRTTPNR